MWTSDRQIENPQALRRIASLLLALAVLAEAAAGRSRPVRSLVLWLLRTAEAAVRAFAAEAALPLLTLNRRPALQLGDGPDAAAELAATLRALAAALHALSRQALCFTQRWAGSIPQSDAGRSRNVYLNSDRHLRAIFAQLPCPDTS